MTANEYQQDALRTISSEKRLNIAGDNLLLEGLMGLSSESGEALDVLKKAMFQGHKLDTPHILEELGDVVWYLTISTYALGYTLEEVFQMNAEKRRARYPDGFDVERSIRREDDDL